MKKVYFQKYEKGSGEDLSNYYTKTECDDLVQIKKQENQIIGWTSITQGEESTLDIRPQLEQGYTRFTILVYLRKGNIRSYRASSNAGKSSRAS